MKASHSRARAYSGIATRRSLQQLHRSSRYPYLHTYPAYIHTDRHTCTVHRLLLSLVSLFRVGRCRGQLPFSSPSTSPQRQHHLQNCSRFCSLLSPSLCFGRRLCFLPMFPFNPHLVFQPIQDYSPAVSVAVVAGAATGPDPKYTHHSRASHSITLPIRRPVSPNPKQEMPPSSSFCFCNHRAGRTPRLAIQPIPHPSHHTHGCCCPFPSPLSCWNLSKLLVALDQDPLSSPPRFHCCLEFPFPSRQPPFPAAAPVQSRLRSG